MPKSPGRQKFDHYIEQKAIRERREAREAAECGRDVPFVARTIDAIEKGEF